MTTGTTPPEIRSFVTCWNEAKFFEAHEVLEALWVRTRDRGQQGLIQLAVALHHLRRGNMVGARTMLYRASTRLAERTNAPSTISLSRMLAYADMVHAGLGRVPAADLISRRPRL